MIVIFKNSPSPNNHSNLNENKSPGNHSYMAPKHHHHCNPATRSSPIWPIWWFAPFHPFARSAYESSLPLEPHQGGGGEQGFFSISSRPTTPMATNGQIGQNGRPNTPMTTNGQNGLLAKTIGHMDSAAPIVETVGAGNQQNFLSVTRLLLSKHTGCFLWLVPPNKLAKLQATLVWNYDPPTHWQEWSVELLA